MAGLAELAEDTLALIPSQPTYERVDRVDLVYIAGPRNATVQRQRLGDIAAALEWTRAESTRRGLGEIEWWVGWSATPTDLGARLLELGLVPDSVPTLTGMTCDSPPPAVSGIEIRTLATPEEYLRALEVDWEVWNIGDDEREQRRTSEAGLFAEIQASGIVHHFAALVDGKPVGFARAVDMPGAVALMGGAVLEEARHRGVYRALVRARWDHAARRGTPLLVVQAGELSAPVLESLGFRAHGVVRLYVDRL